MTTTDNPLCSIIIISYNTKEVTRDCLESVKAAKLDFTYEIIIVDNASTDGSVEMFEQDYPEATLIKNEENLFFPKANNQAMLVAKGKYFFLLNSDTLVEPGQIEKLINFLDQRFPKVGVVGPSVRNKDGTLQSEGHSFDTKHHVIARFLFLHKLPLPFFLKKLILPLGYEPGLYGRTRKVGWVMGCALMFRRELYEEFGGLDGDFVFYCDDMEFCYRTWKHGYEVWVDVRSRITHLGGVSWVVAKQTGESKKLPDYHERRFVAHQKMAGAMYKIRTNRLRIFLYSSILPLFSILSASRKKELQEKIALHREENEKFFKMLAEEKQAKSSAS